MPVEAAVSSISSDQINVIMHAALHVLFVPVCWCNCSGSEVTRLSKSAFKMTREACVEPQNVRVIMLRPLRCFGVAFSYGNSSRGGHAARKDCVCCVDNVWLSLVFARFPLVQPFPVILSAY
jgi:hypothetical protein